MGNAFKDFIFGVIVSIASANGGVVDAGRFVVTDSSAVLRFAPLELLLVIATNAIDGRYKDTEAAGKILR